MHAKTYKKANSYLSDIKLGKVNCGSYLQLCMKCVDIVLLSVEQFIELIIRTKKPQIFAESAVHGDGTDWNQTELSILGDISISVPVTVFDNGLHNHPDVFKDPFDATLLYTPGALLRNGQGEAPADWGEVTKDEEINYDAYYSLYERRLLPVFFNIDSVAKIKKKNAFITIPGLGCGQFAGKFRGQLGPILRNVLIDIIKENHDKLQNIKAIYYDPYSVCNNERFEIGGISFFVKPLTNGNEKKPQLCTPESYEEENDDFSECELFSLVAWDHVSWPGNDFYIGSRATDDGVKAAATNSMTVMTGVSGNYNSSNNKYEPSNEYSNWEMVINKNNIELAVRDNLIVFPDIILKNNI